MNWFLVWPNGVCQTDIWLYKCTSEDEEPYSTIHTKCNIGHVRCGIWYVRCCMAFHLDILRFNQAYNQSENKSVDMSPSIFHPMTTDWSVIHQDERPYSIIHTKCHIQHVYELISGWLDGGCQLIYHITKRISEDKEPYSTIYTKCNIGHVRCGIWYVRCCMAFHLDVLRFNQAYNQSENQSVDMSPSIFHPMTSNWSVIHQDERPYTIIHTKCHIRHVYELISGWLDGVCQLIYHITKSISED
jgi:hypothetical protein